MAPWTTSTDYDNGPCAVGVGSYHRPSTYLARPPAWVPPAPGGPAALRVRAEKEIAELYVASVRARKFGGQLGLGIRGEARELQGATTRSTASRSPFALKLGGWTDRSTLHLSSYGPVEAPFLPSFIWQWREGNALEARNCHRFLLRLTCLAAGLPACLPAFGASSPNSSTEE